MNDEEICAAWAAFDQIGWPYGRFAKLLLLLGVRRGELAGARWREFDLDRALWTIPGSRSKNHVEHHVPLGEDALSILTSLPRFDGKPFVFGSPLHHFSKSRIDALMLAALKTAAAERAEDPDGVTLTGWTMHDLRRVVATNLQQLGVRLEVTETVLGHVGGSRGGIVGIYQRHGFGPEARAALTAWGKRLNEIISGKVETNVVEFSTKAKA